MKNRSTLQKTIRVIAAAAVVALVVVAALYRSSLQAPGVIDSGRRTVMGTMARILVVSPDRDAAQSAIDAAFEELAVIEGLMSVHHSDSEISRINRTAATKPVKVSEPVFEVIRSSIEFSKKTGGAFDITVGPLLRLWQSAQQKGRPPGEDELVAATSRIGYQKIILDEQQRTIRFAAEGVEIDLGGIAKGYAIDRAIEVLRNSDVSGALVDVGGDMRCFGKPPQNEKAWSIGLQDPDVTIDELSGGPCVLYLEVNDRAVATSGDYRRFVTIAGKTYSHIINPAAGGSAEGPASVTIIAETAIAADALATAVSVLGADEGLALIEETPETEAILITDEPDARITTTAGADKYIRNQLHSTGADYRKTVPLARKTGYAATTAVAF